VAEALYFLEQLAVLAQQLQPVQLGRNLHDALGLDVLDVGD
jgi:hypothetical protein